MSDSLNDIDDAINDLIDAAQNVGLYRAVVKHTPMYGVDRAWDEYVDALDVAQHRLREKIKELDAVVAEDTLAKIKNALDEYRKRT